MPLFERWRQLLASLRSAGRGRDLQAPRGVDFTSNDYLGYGRLPPPLDPNLGVSGRASRLLGGQLEIWDEVEQGLARWHGAEAALVMSSGYQANEGLLATVVQAGDYLASDQLNHASIIDGARLCRGQRFVYRHGDLDHLEEGLRAAAQQRTPAQQIFVATESLFSMDGDRAPLTELAALCRGHDAHLIVDEAHATGCFGASGGGLVDELGLRGQVLATVHTGGKALGVPGAYVTGSKLLKEVLVNRCRQLIFTTALPPQIAHWWLAALARVQANLSARTRLHDNARSFRADLACRGLPTLGRDYIVPIVLGEDDQAMRAAEFLQTRGLDIRAVRPPTVPEGTARLRVSIHAEHTKEELQAAAAALEEVWLFSRKRFHS